MPSAFPSVVYIPLLVFVHNIYPTGECLNSFLLLETHPFFKVLSKPSLFLTTPSLWAFGNPLATALKYLLHCYRTVWNHVIFTMYISKSSKCLWIIFPTRLQVSWKLRPFLKLFCICDSTPHSVDSTEDSTPSSKPGWNAFRVFCSSGRLWEASDLKWKDLRERKVKSRVLIRIKLNSFHRMAY